MDEADFVPLSALQHYAYCPRQCALIHLEQIWEENSHTAEGRLMHGQHVGRPVHTLRKTAIPPRDGSCTSMPTAGKARRAARSVL